MLYFEQFKLIIAALSALLNTKQDDKFCVAILFFDMVGE